MQVLGMKVGLCVLGKHCLTVNFIYLSSRGTGSKNQRSKQKISELFLNLLPSAAGSVLCMVLLL